MGQLNIPQHLTRLREVKGKAWKKRYIISGTHHMSADTAWIWSKVKYQNN